MTLTAAQIKSIAGTGVRPCGRDREELAYCRPHGTAPATSSLKIMTETGGLRILSESGAYSAARVSQIFGAGHHRAGITPGEARSIAACLSRTAQTGLAS